MARTVVGLFNSTSEAQRAIEQLLATGFPRTTLHMATPDTLRAAHLPAIEGETEPPVEPLGTGFIRFFTDLFAGDDDDPDAAQTHAAYTHADSAVITVRAATEEAADRARLTLTQHGAVDVYKQATPMPPGPNDDVIDLTGGLRRVRDNDELDANGLTTH